MEEFLGKDRYVQGKHPVKIESLWWQDLGLSKTASGYGKKLPTIWKMQFKGRWRRVYCCIYSNVGTLYIFDKNSKGGFLIVDYDNFVYQEAQDEN